MANKKGLRIDTFLVLCDNCDNPASYLLSLAVGWVGCAPCITGEADSLDDEDIIISEEHTIRRFLNELSKFKKERFKQRGGS
jgi:hypothetical protein